MTQKERFFPELKQRYPDLHISLKGEVESGAETNLSILIGFRPGTTGHLSVIKPAIPQLRRTHDRYVEYSAGIDRSNLGTHDYGIGLYHAQYDWIRIHWQVSLSMIQFYWWSLSKDMPVKACWYTMLPNKLYVIDSERYSLPRLPQLQA